MTIQIPLSTIVDAHLHYYNFTSDTDGFEKLISQMNQANVNSAVIFGTSLVKMWDNRSNVNPRRYTDGNSPMYGFSATDYMLLNELSHQQSHIRRRFHPFISGIDPRDKNSINFIKRIVSDYPKTIAGIGEILLRYEEMNQYRFGDEPQADCESMFEIYDYAAISHFPVLIHNNIAIHSDISPRYLEEVETALSYNRDTNIIWAHMGITPQIHLPNFLELMCGVLEDNKNLYYDISWAVFDNYIAKDRDSLDKWKIVIEKYPNRFVIGTDLNGRFVNYQRTLERYSVLNNILSIETLKKIYGENILSLIQKY